jgi:hypothetical protein
MTTTMQVAGGLPHIERPLDNTALSAYMACPREYYLAMVLHRRSGGRGAPLAYGGLIHNLLENHYKSGGATPIVEQLGHLWWARNGHSDPTDHRTLERGLLDYQRYRAKWGESPQDEQGRTIGWPDEPLVEISADIMGGGLLHPWAVKIDRVIELGGLNYVEDHKTTSRLDKNYYTSFELSNQMMGYTRIAQLLMPDLHISGIRLNVVHVLKDKTNFERQLFSWTQDQLLEWEETINQWALRVNSDSLDWPTEEQLAAGAPWPLAHFGDNGCSRKYGLCGYHSICSIGRRMRYKALSELPIHPWNPLEIDD